MSEWFKHYPRKMLDACEGLGSATLVAVYRTVIDRIYECDGPIPNQPASIGRYACLKPSKVAAAITTLVELNKLYLTDGGKLMNPRADQELERRKEISAARAEAGAKGGLGTKTGSSRPQGEPKLSPSGPLRDSAGPQPTSRIAENSHSQQAIASTRAREEIKEKQEESPSPPKRPPGFDGLMPDFDAPLDPAERAATIAKLDIVDRDGERPDGVDVAQLTGQIMREAKIVVPPSDLVLVDSWVRLGVEPDKIIEIVVRMASCARSPVRAMRYFDAEIRRVHEAEKSSSNANIAYFDACLRRAKRFGKG